LAPRAFAAAMAASWSSTITPRCASRLPHWRTTDHRQTACRRWSTPGAAYHPRPPRLASHCHVQDLAEEAQVPLDVFRADCDVFEIGAGSLCHGDVPGNEVEGLSQAQFGQGLSCGSSGRGPGRPCGRGHRRPAGRPAGRRALHGIHIWIVAVLSEEHGARGSTRLLSPLLRTDDKVPQTVRAHDMRPCEGLRGPDRNPS
jgi:hypothetical protein